MQIWLMQEGCWEGEDNDILPLNTIGVTPTVVTFEDSLGGRNEIECGQVECRKEQDVPRIKRKGSILISTAKLIKQNCWIKGVTRVVTMQCIKNQIGSL